MVDGRLKGTVRDMHYVCYYTMGQNHTRLMIAWQRTEVMVTTTGISTRPGNCMSHHR